MAKTKPPEYVEKFEFVSSVVHNPVIRFFGSLQLGLTVLTLIAIASTIGEFLPHESGMSLRIVFKTWWYRSLLTLQGVNLLLNTYMTYVEVTYPQFLPFFRKNGDIYKGMKIKHRANFKQTRIEDSRGLMASLAKAFHQLGYRTFYDADGLYAHRGLISRFGSTVTHLGLISIILGSLGESLFKEDGNVNLAEGETADYYSKQDDGKDKNPLGFSVTCRDFEFTEYPGTSTALKYKTTLTFTDKNGNQDNEFVRVNHKVSYQGWFFHQTSYRELSDKEAPSRYFVKLAENLPDGNKKNYEFETYLISGQKEITPLPGHNDLFFAVESGGTRQEAIWSVATKEKLLARSVKSPMGDYRIEMVRFFPDYAKDEATGDIFNKSNDPNNPAALIAISLNKEMIGSEWVFTKDRKPPESAGEPQSAITFVITDVAMDPIAMADAGAQSPMEKIGGATPSDSSAKGIENRAVVTIALEHSSIATNKNYRLKKGQPIPMAESENAGLDIPGNYTLESFNKIPTYMTTLAISKNPGIPVVWLGAIFASSGPVLAFFVSRRRVWAFVDWNKKTLWIGGESRYSREALEDELAEVMARWSADKEVQMQPEIRIAVPGSRPKLSTSL